mmetsp:Transcript_3567/g.12822  ORF Transcript_3567/g.12822 Transcript_3567/m.12822 type:complete len:156 (-) Transcript_3567:212-679(-)
MASVVQRLRAEYAKELALYESCHQQRLNVLIHMAMVPVEVGVSLAWLGLLSPVIPVLLAVGTAAYYLVLQTPYSLLAAAGQCVLGFSALALARRCQPIQLCLWTVPLYVVSWVMQIVVGHGLLEKKKPAMATQLSLNSVVLSVLMAWTPPKQLRD